MTSTTARMPGSIALPSARLCVGITGHRNSNAAFGDNHAGIEAALSAIFDTVDTVISRQPDTIAPTRLHSLLAHGADLMAVEHALTRNWDVSAPIPFGLSLNIAINAHPETAEDAVALVEGTAQCSADVAGRAAHMRDLAARVQRVELAEQDALVGQLFTAMMRTPGDPVAVAAYSTLASERAAAAGRIMIEQSDLLIAIWDGVTPGAVGGTRHTIAAALDQGAPVIWIDAAAPGRLKILHAPEDLLIADGEHSIGDLEALIEATINPPSADQSENAIRFHTEQWHPHSNRRFHAYRRIEALFGGRGNGAGFSSLIQTYETPAQIATGSGASLLARARALPNGNASFTGKIETQVLQRFAWADGLSTYLSDAYRGGMVTNFLLSAFAIIGGVAYLPFASADSKWPFALFEFALLAAILSITTVGQKRRWHGRWFETRRVAEYFRHAPILLLLGVARSPGRWPRGSDTQWPEYYARLALREIGLPTLIVTQDYLRAALETLLGPHARMQRDYHSLKAVRLTTVHHRLDRMSEILFTLAVAAVAIYLVLVASGAAGIIPEPIAHSASKTFTFLGVALPALGGAFAGIRYFGDFERFAAISEVTAEKLDVIGERIENLLSAPQGRLRYTHVANLAHAMDDVVIAEIESWQSVFAGKQIAVPV
jgi:hypothetical protein